MVRGETYDKEIAMPKKYFLGATILDLKTLALQTTIMVVIQKSRFLRDFTTISLDNETIRPIKCKYSFKNKKF